VGILPHLKISELAWRWAELSADVQLQLQPLDQTESLLADVRSREFFDDRGARPPFVQMGMRRTEDAAAVATWLRAHLPGEEMVTASWGENGDSAPLAAVLRSLDDLLLSRL
jgi:hypothetical protein